MLTNSELGGNLTLIYDYNLKRRQYEDRLFRELKQLDKEFLLKVKKIEKNERIANGKRTQNA
jgi:hypothetical protein